MTTTDAGAATVALDLMPRARELWRMMAEGEPPLPAYAGLDLLLNDLDGEARRRGECLRLLWAAGAEWVEAFGSDEDDLLVGRPVLRALLQTSVSAMRRGAWSVAERKSAKVRAVARRILADGGPPFPRLDLYFGAARRIRTAARLVRDLKKCP